MKKIRCAIAGATGIVGQNFIRLLHNHPNFELASICAGDARIGQEFGKTIPFVQTPLPTDILRMPLDAMDIETLRKREIAVVFSALPADIANSFEIQAANAGLAVFSNASAHRMDADVPILIPEINADHLQLVELQKKRFTNGGFIVTNANCTTTGLVLALAPLLDLDLYEIVIASYQALSGAGYPGYSAMEMSANCIPYIAGEEKKVEIEVEKIFGKIYKNTIQPVDWNIAAHCVRVPTIVGHLISVHAIGERELPHSAIEYRFQNFKPGKSVLGLPTAPVQPILLLNEPDRPQPRLDVNAGEPARARGMAISVGRLTVLGPIIRFITLSHNLIRGAAGGSILNAELALREGLL